MSSTPADEGAARRKRSTSTSNFGVGRRESHDASDFYARFTTPVITNDAKITRQRFVDWVRHGDARAMDVGAPRLEENSVALVVTSPPYFAGKEYEEALGEGHVPDSYQNYLKMLRDVFEICIDKLEPGGRIAVNVANLGRKPYRSLSADVIRILQDDLHLLLRGEIIWRKAEGASGNCAWGSFRSASNPVLRDLTERVVVASKGRFDRATTRSRRQQHSFPHEDTIYKEDFMDWTTDVWDIPTESATRVGHPAPFPVELPQRLIELYTYRGDVVLDPFMGSGTTAVAAVRTHRHFVGFDTDKRYVDLALERIAQAQVEQGLHESENHDIPPWRLVPPSLPIGGTEPDSEDFQRRATREGRMAKELARQILTESGFRRISADERIANGVEVNFAARDANNNRWFFDVSGAFSKGARAGLRRTDTLWKALGKAAVLKESGLDYRLVLLTTDLPGRSSAGGRALMALRGKDRVVFDAIEMLTAEGQHRLHIYAASGPDEPIGELYRPGAPS